MLFAKIDLATTLLCVLALLIYDLITFIVKEDLVYNATTDKIVGFTDLGPNRSTKEDLATHALQIYIRSITSRFSRPFAFFSTKNIKAHSLASIFWEVVYILLTCGFDVVGLVADSASIFFYFFFSRIFILLSRESDQCAIRARLGVASHLSTTPRWGNPAKCLSQRHNK